MRTTPALLLLLLVAACAAPLEHTPPAPTPTPTSPPTAAATAATPTTLFIVRHAERMSEEDRDSPLSEAGHARARALADALSEAGIQAIYTTQYRRTRETAAPLAERLGLTVTPETTPGGTAPARDLARRVAAAHPGGTVLLVGHSNTVPAMVHALGGPELPELHASRYGDLFIVTLHPDGPVRTVRVQFGGAGDPRLAPAGH